MRVSNLKLFAILPLLLSTSAFADSLDFDSIFKGTPVSAGGQTWRSTVALSFNGFACTGVFIARNLIVTAAHCSITDDSEIVAELRNGNSLNATSITLAPGEFKAFKHPNYIPLHNPTAGINDLQLVVLKNSILPANFSPASILPPNMADLTNASGSITIVGAGTNGQGGFSDRLMFATGTITGYEEGTVMVVNLENGQGICGGDSGGPVFTKSGSTLYLSAIINARANDVANECGGTLYSARLTSSAVSWISETAASARLSF